MADVTLMTIPAATFVGDNNEALVAGDAPATFGEAYDRRYLEFDDTAEECAITQGLVMPTQYAAGTLYAEIHYIMASATTGKVDWEVAVEAVTEADALDLDAADGFDAINEITGGDTVPGTAGYLGVARITLTNKDSVAAGDMFRLAVRRDTDDADDTATGDARLIAVELIEDQS